MPVGLIAMKWDQRMGVKILMKYPEENDINEMTLMQVYTQHKYSGEKGTINLNVGTLNILSYYSGPELAHYIILILSPDENPDDLESFFINISQIILQNLKQNKFKELIPSLFNKLLQYKSISENYNLALTYQDESKRMIINRLREEGVCDKAELKAWLKDKYRDKYIDAEAIFIDLIKNGIIKESSVKGKDLPSLLIFLLNDLMIYRKPAFQLSENFEKLGLPSQFIKKYQNEYKVIFSSYKPTEEDNVKIINVFTDPRTLDLIETLKTKIITKDQIKSKDNLEKSLEILSDSRIITIFKDNEKEYIALLCDLHIKTFFPEYILNKIKSIYKQKSIPKQILLEYLNILEIEYLGIK